MAPHQMLTLTLQEDGIAGAAPLLLQGRAYVSYLGDDQYEFVGTLLAPGREQPTSVKFLSRSAAADFLDQIHAHVHLTAAIAVAPTEVAKLALNGEATFEGFPHVVTRNHLDRDVFRSLLLILRDGGA